MSLLSSSVSITCYKVSGELQKPALETLFLKSFNLTLIHLFPYTTADLVLGLEGPERDRLAQLEPTKFTES